MDLSTPQFEQADAFYSALLNAHEGLTSSQSALLNAKLVLLMANQIGRTHVLEALLTAARQDIPTDND